MSSRGGLTSSELGSVFGVRRIRRAVGVAMCSERYRASSGWVRGPVVSREVDRNGIREALRMVVELNFNIAYSLNLLCMLLHTSSVLDEGGLV